MTELEEQLAQENARLREKLATKDERIVLLEQKVEALIRLHFGKSSEKLDPDQLELLLGEDGPGKAQSSDGAGAPEEDDAGAARVEKKPRNSRRPRIPEHLPVVEKVLEPEAVKACPEAWRRIGEEVSEQIDYEPGRFFRRRLILRKYVKRSDPHAAPITAARPEKLKERCLAAPGLLAHVLVQKYQDHLPFYRQQQIFATRYGVEIGRHTLCRWSEMCADWLRPLYHRILDELCGGDYLQVDETPIRYLEAGRGKSAQGYFWTVTRPGGDVFFHWAAGRGHHHLKKVLGADKHGRAAFCGTLQSDGFSAYDTYAAKHEGIVLAGCWAHVRRKFLEACEAGQPEAARELKLIQQLYRVERQLRESRAGPEERLAMRKEFSTPIIASLFELFQQHRSDSSILPKSPLGKALDYALGQGEKLRVLLGNGQVEVDNNGVENAIRPTAVGKKNWLFIGRQDTGWRSAILYTIIGSCLRRGIDPHAYLEDVLTRLPSMTTRQIDQLLPANWPAIQSRATKQAS